VSLRFLSEPCSHGPFIWWLQARARWYSTWCLLSPTCERGQIRKSIYNLIVTKQTNGKLIKFDWSVFYQGDMSDETIPFDAGSLTPGEISSDTIPYMILWYHFIKFNFVTAKKIWNKIESVYNMCLYIF
jgi:hypothetical protein